MKKSDVINLIFPPGNKNYFTPHQEKGLAFAPTNVALCKYWGKRDYELNLPMTSSISVTLPDMGALTTLTVSEKNKDTINLNDTLVIEDTEFYQRVINYLDLFRPEKRWHVDIDIRMNVPVAAGLASSACGYASLVAALNDLFSWNLNQKELSILARLGSGSAARSLWTGFVEWHAGVQKDGMDSYAEPLPFEWSEMNMGVLLISEQAKPLSSRVAMERTVNSSPLYRSWPQKVLQDMVMMRQALQAQNFSLFAGTAESNALAMHATMLSSWPPICYFLPETIAAMHKIWDLRKQGLSLYFTQDAGPNLKLLFLEKEKESVKANFPAVEVIKLFDLST